MNYNFASIPSVNIQRSVFNRSHSLKTTFDEGYLVPVLLEEVCPGDSWKLDNSIFARLASPLQVPIMDDMQLDVHYFFVPNRLLWEHWENMMGQQVNPGDSTDYLVPQITAPSDGWPVGSIADYFGIPTGVANIKVSALPFRAYNLIYNEWYRDQNLQQSLPNFVDDGGSAQATWLGSDGVKTVSGTEQDYWASLANDAKYPYRGTLKRRNKLHDYFTSCLPWPQKGPGVELPIGGVAPIGLYTSDKSSGGFNANGMIPTDYKFVTWTGGAGGSSTPFAVNAAKEGQTTTTEMYPNFKNWTQDNFRMLGVDLSNATMATINSLRQAFQIQRLYERDARGGTRYTEILRSHFGVISPDARLQRPEYLGGTSQRIIINPVTQTSSTDASTPQGNLAAFGVTGSSTNGFRKSFVEHGYIIGLVSVRSMLTYQQGIPRFLSRRTRFDFYWPTLAHLGEQAVLNKEIYAQGTDADNEAFGYQERWAEYRYHPGMITGKMRSTSATPLDYWHLGQKFDSLPKLNEEFIRENAPLDRCVAVPSEPHFLLDIFFVTKVARPMPVYSVPGLIDHF